jgi:hypothetical protein
MLRQDGKLPLGIALGRSQKNREILDDDHLGTLQSALLKETRGRFKTFLC